MQRLKVVLIIGYLFVTAGSYASTQPIIKIAIDNNEAVIGKVIRLEVIVRTGESARVSWQLCNELFSQSQQITLLATDSITARGYAKYRVAFTCVKPIHLSISSLPVLINAQKFLTPSFKVNFKPERPISTLYNIKPVYDINWLNPLAASGKVILLLLIIWFISAVLYLRLKKRISSRASSKIKHNCLKKLAVLESAAERKAMTPFVLANKVSDVLTEYLQQITITPDHQLSNITPGEYDELFGKFRESVERVRFLPQPAAQLLYPVLINNARDFILTHQPAA
ncbi:MAG TPA: hypothetical protein VK668_22785 [Mucilaginibacter sp.]|nr:hypothetical protein [Mucilaginibacter sp.]